MHAEFQHVHNRNWELVGELESPDVKLNVYRLIKQIAKASRIRVSL